MGHSLEPGVESLFPSPSIPLSFCLGTRKYSKKPICHDITPHLVQGYNVCKGLEIL